MSNAPASPAKRAPATDGNAASPKRPRTAKTKTTPTGRPTVAAHAAQVHLEVGLDGELSYSCKRVDLADTELNPKVTVHDAVAHNEHVLGSIYDLRGGKETDFAVYFLTNAVPCHGYLLDSFDPVCEGGTELLDGLLEDLTLCDDPDRASHLYFSLRQAARNTAQEAVLLQRRDTSYVAGDAGDATAKADTIDAFAQFVIDVVPDSHEERLPRAPGLDKTDYACTSKMLCELDWGDLMRCFNDEQANRLQTGPEATTVGFVCHEDLLQQNSAAASKHWGVNHFLASTSKRYAEISRVINYVYEDEDYSGSDTEEADYSDSDTDSDSE